MRNWIWRLSNDSARRCLIPRSMKFASADATLFGAVTTPPNIPDYFSPVVRMRQSLELYANLRPCKSIPHESSKSGIDMLIVRENTEGLYSGIERLEDDGNRAITERVITRKGSERIIRKAFDIARQTERKTSSCGSQSQCSSPNLRIISYSCV